MPRHPHSGGYAEVESTRDAGQAKGWIGPSCRAGYGGTLVPTGPDTRGAVKGAALGGEAKQKGWQTD